MWRDRRQLERCTSSIDFADLHRSWGFAAGAASLASTEVLPAAPPGSSSSVAITVAFEGRIAHLVGVMIDSSIWTLPAPSAPRC